MFSPNHDSKRKIRNAKVTGKSNSSQHKIPSQQQKTRKRKKISTKTEMTNLKNEYIAEWIKSNEDFFSTFSLGNEQGFNCDVVRSVDDSLSEGQSLDTCISSSFPSSSQQFIPKSPEDNSTRSEEVMETSPFSNANDRRKQDRYVRHLVQQKLRSQRPIRNGSSVGEQKSLDELFRDMEISLKEKGFRLENQRCDEDSEEEDEELYSL
ncbi:hypothetical protein RB195_020884 [Necator americanus]|uniref:Uncharacterized protein n=1 Tax=Necator americanus TaxID=51031 RepID=A0ABR1CL13_NECAM